jgi:uncharacterized protein with FMN-binding domain
MGGTKIFVLQLKDLIRIGLLTVLGIVLLVLLLIFLIPRGEGAEAAEIPITVPAGPVAPTARYIPGTYTSTIILNDEPVSIRVTVSENEILSIYMADMGDVQRVFYPLFEPRMRDLAEQILRYQSAHIEPQTDYPVTTSILQQAIIAALELAYSD